MIVRYNANMVDKATINVEYVLRNERETFLVGPISNSEDRWNMNPDNEDRLLVVSIVYDKDDNDNFYCNEKPISLREEKVERGEITGKMKYYLGNEDNEGEYVNIENFSEDKTVILQPAGELGVFNDIFEKIERV